MIEELVAIAIIAAPALWGGIRASRKRKREVAREFERRNPYRRIGRYEIRPFPSFGDLFTIEEFQDCLKRWHMTDGTSRWACADGEFFDTASNGFVRADPHEIREGKIPESFFTHIRYYGK